MRRRDLLTAAGVGLAGLGLGEARAQAVPIKIGVLAPLSSVGREMVDGATLFVDKMNSTVAGRTVALIVEDDGSDPDTALQQARLLVEQEKVDFLIGDGLAGTGMALANYARTAGTPYFCPTLAADDLTQRHPIANVVRVAGYSASQFSHRLGAWAYSKGYRRIAMVAQDDSFGYEQSGGFAQTFTDAGGQIVRQFWHPLNTADFSPTLGQLPNLRVDAVFTVQTGADAMRFIQQFSSSGLKASLPLLAAMDTTDQSVIRTMGAECDGIITAAHYAEGSDGPAMKTFVADYTSRFGITPSIYGFSMYSAMMWCFTAIAALGGRLDDRAAFLDAVRNTQLTDSPLGTTVILDDYGNPVYDVFIRKVVQRSDGKFWNVPTETYDNLSQFWTYDPAAYLKQPPYSRNFQGIKTV